MKWRPWRRACWCGSGLEAGFCSHRRTGTGGETRLQRAVRTNTNPTRKRRGRSA